MCGCKGIANFCRSDGLERVKPGAKILQPVVQPDLRVKAMCGKEAFLLKAIWLLCGYKVTGLPAAKSGYSICLFALYSLEIINVVIVFIGINELPYGRFSSSLTAMTRGVIYRQLSALRYTYSLCIA